MSVKIETSRPGTIQLQEQIAQSVLPTPEGVQFSDLPACQLVLAGQLTDEIIYARLGLRKLEATPSTSPEVSSPETIVLEATEKAAKKAAETAEKAIELGLLAFSKMYERESRRPRRTRSAPLSDYEEVVSSLCPNPRHPVVIAALGAMIKGQEHPVISPEDVTRGIGDAALKILAERASLLASVEEPQRTVELVSL